MKPLRFVLDSNIYDCFINADLTLNELHVEKVNRCIQAGLIEIYITHVQVDEHNATPNKSKRNALADVRYKLPARLIATSGAIWDVSKWDMCTYDNGAGEITLEQIQKGNPKHSEDALISATASAGADVFVTNEKQLKNKINNLATPLHVWTFTDFIVHVQDLLSSGETAES